MPKRTQNHIVADRAVEQIGSIITEAGWAWERVQQDYGEDLHIQPFFAEVAEPFRLWLQVKGTENIGSYRDKRRQVYRYRFPIAHALKWHTSSELVLPVLWDVTKKRGYYCFPDDFGSAWDITMSQRKTLLVEFPPRRRLSGERIAQVGWVARLRYYDRRIGQYLAVLLDGHGSKVSHEGVRKEMLLAAFECLSKLNIFDEEMNFCETFKRIPEVAKRLERDTRPLSTEEVMSGVTYEGMAATLIIMSIIEERTPGGCPANLATVLPEVARQVLATSRKLWGKRKRSTQKK